MSIRPSRFVSALILTAALFTSSRLLTGQAAATAQQPAAAPANDIPAASLLQPDELVPMLTAKERPIILQVGSRMLFEQAHIVGSEYAGSAGTAEGLHALRVRAEGLKPDQSIVLYCGCCPWNRCPNIRAAFELLHTMGFTHVKALYLQNNFGKDWVDRGFAVAKGQ